MITELVVLESSLVINKSISLVNHVLWIKYKSYYQTNNVTQTVYVITKKKQEFQHKKKKNFAKWSLIYSCVGNLK